MANKKPSRFRTPRALRDSFVSIRGASREYLSRRPHRSFTRTRRRDYVRSLELPGYWAFNAAVARILLTRKKLFAGLALLYATLAGLFVGMSSQDIYGQLSELLSTTSGGLFDGGWEAIGQSGLLLLSGLAGSINPQLTEAQQIYAFLILLLTWLTTVWLLRAVMAGKRPRLRDGLYNAGAPIVPTAILLLVLIIQLLPATIGIIVMSSAMSTELFESGFMSMVISVLVVLLVILSLYWIVSTMMALIIVTLPGMYPWRALRTAGDLVIGRRIRLLLRIVWLAFGNFLIWVVIVLPTILVERWLSQLVPFLRSVPIIPVVILAIGAVLVVWSAAYMYLLYRKVVEDDASPA